MRQQLWWDGQFINASALNAAEQTSFVNLQDTINKLFNPGLVNVERHINTNISGNKIYVYLDESIRVLFGNGVLGSPVGNLNGTVTPYVLDMTAFVPSSGTVVAYVVAIRADGNFNNIVVSGPPPGHPAYDPTFSPFNTFATTQPLINLTATTTPPDNVNTFEICRTILSAGQTAITNIDLSYEIFAGPKQNVLQTPTFFETSGPFTLVVPPGVNSVSMEIGGGGGAGASCNNSGNGNTNANSVSGGGGAAGDQAVTTLQVRQGDVISGYIGGGGTSGQPGQAGVDGGDTSVSINDVVVLYARGGQTSRFFYTQGWYSPGGVSGYVANGAPPLYLANFYYRGSSGGDGQQAGYIFTGNGAPGYRGMGAGRAGGGGGVAGLAASAGGGGAYDLLGTNAVHNGGAGAAGYAHFYFNQYGRTIDSGNSRFQNA